MDSEIIYKVPEYEIQLAEVLLKYYKEKDALTNTTFKNMRDDFMSKMFKTKIEFEGKEIYVALAIVMSDVLAKEYQYSGEIKIMNKKMIDVINMSWKIDEDNLDLVQYINYYNLPNECIAVDYTKITMSKIKPYINSIALLDDKLAWELNSELTKCLVNFKFLMSGIELSYIFNPEYFYENTKIKIRNYLLYYHKLMNNKLFRDSQCEKSFVVKFISNASINYLNIHKNCISNFLNDNYFLC